MTYAVALVYRAKRCQLDDEQVHLVDSAVAVVAAVRRLVRRNRTTMTVQMIHRTRPMVMADRMASTVDCSGQRWHRHT